MSFKNKREGIPMFLAGFACAAMLAALLATIPESRAATDCADTPMPVQTYGAISIPGGTSVDQYIVTYGIPGCLVDQGFKFSSARLLSNQCIQVNYKQ